MDFALYPTTGPDAVQKFFLFNGVQNPGQNIGWEVPIGSFEELFPSTYLSWNGKIMSEQGIVAVQNDAAILGRVNFNTYSGIYAQYTKTVTFPTPSQSTCDNSSCSNNYQSINIPKKYISGDFNGDGLTDVIALEYGFQTSGCSLFDDSWNLPTCNSWYDTNSSRKTYFIDLDRRNTTNFFNFSGILQDEISNASQFIVADMNGDGKSDILHFVNNGIKVYSLNETRQLVLISTRWGVTVNGPILVMDYNGDGLSDIAIPKVNTNQCMIYLSSGSNYNGTNSTLPFIFWDSNEIYSNSLIPNDFNNDGKTDLTAVTSARYRFLNGFLNGYQMVPGDNYGYMTVSNFKNTGNGFSACGVVEIGKNPGAISISNPGSPAIKKWAMPIFLPSTAQNLNLSLSIICDNTIYNFNSNKDSARDMRLKSITNGNGVQENINYKPLKDEGCNPYCSGLKFYTHDYSSSENYPNTNVNIASNYFLFSNINKNGLNQDFGYYGGVSNTQGFGFQGFKAVARTNFYNSIDIPTITTFSQFNPALRGALVSDYTILGTTSLTGAAPTSSLYKQKSLFV